jgi:phosphoglycolate phosphatase
MGRDFHMVIFDLDGTLADTIADVAYGVNEALGRMDFPPIPLEQVKKAVGPGRDEFIRMIFPNVKNPDTKAFLSIFREIYWDHCLDQTSLFEGMDSVLARLRGRRLGVASNKPKAFSEKILKGLGVRGHFNEVMGPEDVVHAKPHPEMIIKLLERVNGKPAKTLLVGDTDKDMLAGRGAGVGICGVSYGYGRVEDIERQNPDFMIECPADLLEIIVNHD